MYEITITTDRTGKQALTMYQTEAKARSISSRLARSVVGESKIDVHAFNSWHEMETFIRSWLKSGRYSWRTDGSKVPL